MRVIRGRVWTFGDDVNTDAIAPARYMVGPIEELAKHSLEAINPGFPKQVRPGDVIVGGANFGCGSSREQAPAALKVLQLGAVVAESYARIFFRNAIAIGLPIIVCPNVLGCFVEGDELELDMTNATVTNLTTRKTFAAQPLPDEMKEVLLKGGILSLLKEIASKSME